MITLIKTSAGIFSLNNLVKVEYNQKTNSLLVFLNRPTDGLLLLHGQEAKTLYIWLSNTAVFDTTT